MSLPPPQTRGDLSWFAPLSIDLILAVLKITAFHPFVVWMVPLGFRAQAMSWNQTAMQVSITWASLLTILYFLNVFNKQVAYAKPRKVDLSEEVIVITGGASGLGLLIAEVYGMRGATVAVLDVRELEEEEARGVTWYKCDVADREQVVKVAAQIEQDLGTPTILINNAGIVNGKTILNLSFDEVERTINVNLLSHFYTIKSFLPAMLRTGRGTIVTISSVLAHLGAAQLSDYSASKAALPALHHSITAELHKEGHSEQIRTILVTPGQLTTPMFAGVDVGRIRNFFGPVIEPVDVAKEIIKMIDGGGSGVLAMPFYARWIGWMEVMPVAAQRLLRWASGIDRGMEGWKGRGGLKSEEKESLI